MKLFIEISQVIENAFKEIEETLPSPVFVEIGSSKVFRYQDKSVEAAIVQKCARMISGLNASIVLLESGYVQELGALFRMLDEFNEDILFLCQATREDEITELHKKYLEMFYQEEFNNPDSPYLSEQKRDTIPRRKIHAAISRIPGQELNPSDSQQVYRTLSQTYSGYVHAASPHVMEMYGGYPSKYHVSGMLGTPRITEFTNNAWDYFYRSLITIMMVAQVFEKNELLTGLYEFRAYVEEQSDKTEWESPEELIKREKAKKV